MVQHSFLGAHLRRQGEALVAEHQQLSFAGILLATCLPLVLYTLPDTHSLPKLTAERLAPHHTLTMLTRLHSVL